MIYVGQGKSGWPFLEGPALVETSEPTGLRVGDLAVFLSGSVPTCHRILRRRKRGALWWYLFKGDANPAFDGWVPEYRVQGKVTAVNGKTTSLLSAWTACALSWLCLPYLCQQTRKWVGHFLFNFLWRPPSSPSATETSDYGHAEFHDELIIRESQDVDFALRTLGALPQRALDLGGGSGRLAIPLVGRGHSVCLVENSKAMLVELGRRVAGLSSAVKTRLQIIESDLREFQTAEKFSHIFLLNNVLEHLPAEADSLRLLQTVSNRLPAGGRIYLDVHNLEYFESRRDWKNGRWRYHSDGYVQSRRFRLWSRTLPGESVEQVVLEHATRHGREPFQVSRLPLRLRYSQQWRTIFEQAGLQVHEAWGNWQGAPLQRNFPKAIFVLGPSSKSADERLPN